MNQPSTYAPLWTRRPLIFQRPNFISDSLSLGKAGISAMVVLATAWGYLIGQHNQVAWTRLTWVLLGTFLVAAGSGALNQYLERDVDALMRRTRNRPLPAGRIRAPVALTAGLGLALAGAALLGIAANLSSFFLGLAVTVLYVAVYTPLKRITVLNTFVGAVPGAAPPILGWVASGRDPNGQTAALFLLMYIWQLPHVLAIAWRYKEDYAVAGLRMLSLNDAHGRRTRALTFLFSSALVPVSAYPAIIGLAGRAYFYGALAISGVFLAVAMYSAWKLSDKTARLVFYASIAYLPLIFGLMLIDPA